MLWVLISKHLTEAFVMSTHNMFLWRNKKNAITLWMKNIGALPRAMQRFLGTDFNWKILCANYIMQNNLQTANLVGRC